MSRFIPSAILLLALCSLFNNAIAQTVNNNSQQKTLNDPVPYLTGGFSSDQQMAAGNSCANQDPTWFSYQGSSKSVLGLGDLRDFNQFEEDLNVNVTGSGGYGMFSGSTEASYAREVESNNYSEGFYYDEIITLPTKVYAPQALGLNMLNTFGQQAEQLDTTGQAFRGYCGDQYVIQTPLGAKLIVSLKLDFSSQLDRKNFDYNTQGGMSNIFNASAAISSAVSKYNLHGSLSVYALQEGGDPTQIAKIFGTPTCGGHYCVSTCDLNNLSACQGIIDGIIGYAQNNLPGQIDFTSGQPTPSATPLSYTFAPYPGVKVGQTVITDAITAARDQLSDIYTQQLQQYVFLTHLLNSPYVVYRLNSVYAQELTVMEKALFNNLEILEDPTDGAAACFQDPVDCATKPDGSPGIAPTLINSLQPIDQALYNIANSAYYATDAHAPQPFYLIPIDGDPKTGIISYARFGINNMAFDVYETLFPTATGYHITGENMVSHMMLYGDITKQPDGSYTGTITYSGQGIVAVVFRPMIYSPL